MLKTIIKLSDGTELSSGANQRNAIQSVTLTKCVNSGEDLVLGSTCANAFEATLITPDGGLSLEAGTEVAVYKDDGTVQKAVGIFILEKPTRPTANTMKVTGYDRISKLDKDLSAWLSGLTAWPYTLIDFARMVCESCGLEFKQSEVVNSDFFVQQFTQNSVTGRQIMQWLGEICASFCRATPDGKIEFAWYTDSDKTITSGGEIYYFQNALSYEDYQTAKIDAVRIRLANSSDGVLWPDSYEANNCYVITGNAILNAQITEELIPVLENIHAAIADVSYTPAKVSIPANMDIGAGNTVCVSDKNGKNIVAYVMTKTQTGQKDTLECTGNRTRNTTVAVNNKTVAEAAKTAVDNQTQSEVFNKLTNNGEAQGIFMKDGQLYINASYLATGVITSADGTIKIDLLGNKVSVTTSDGKGRIDISSAGIEGYGYFENYEAELKTLEIAPGFNVGDETYLTHITSGFSREGLFIYTGYPGAVLGLGDGDDLVYIKNKNVSWKENGDGTYTLIGT